MTGRGEALPGLEHGRGEKLVWAEAGGADLTAAVDRTESDVHWPRVAAQAALCGLIMAAVLTLRSSASLNFIYFSF